MNPASRSCFLLSLGLAALVARNGAAADPPPHRAGEPFELTVVGPDGKPVPGVKVEVSTNPLPTAEQVTRGTFVRRGEYAAVTTADDEGRLAVLLPESFSLHIKQPGFGPYLADWTSGAPSHFTAELDAGWSVGGIVVDEQGRAVEGATVGLFIEYKKRPGDVQQMDAGARTTTDAAGAWQYDSVPAPLNDVSVEIAHASYMPLSRKLTRSDFGLVAGASPAAKIVLPQGLTVEGLVTDDVGQPIAGALIRTKFLNDVREARTGDDGRYKLVGCRAAMTSIIASASGRAMDLQTVRVDSEMDPVNFQLKPGGKIRVRVVDAGGAPVPKTRIFFQRWRGHIDYFEFDHLNDRADDRGVWEWNEAPLDEIQVDVCPPDGMQLLEQPLVARDDEYVFRTSPQLVVSGSVFDAETGEPVKKFRVVPGITVGPGNTQWPQGSSRDGIDGRYHIEADRGYDGHFVRIEADGYRAAVSRELESDEGEVTIDFKLERSPAVAGKLLTPAGAPAAGAKLAIGVDGAQINVENGDLDDSSTYAARVTADDVGGFQFPAQDGPFHLVIVHPAGFGYFKTAEQEIPDTITLTAWARVEGTFRAGAEPVGGVTLTLNSESLIHSYGPGQPSIFVSHEATTNADGRFTFKRVYPGAGRLGRRILRMVDEGATEVTSSKMEPIQLVAGETTEFALGGRGRPVVGRIVPPATFKGKVLWNFASLRLQASMPQAPPLAPNDPLAAQKQQAWRQAQQKRQDATPFFWASCDATGAFRIDDVPPGDYLLNVDFDDHPAGRLRDYRLTVPPIDGEHSDDPLDLGELQLTP